MEEDEDEEDQGNKLLVDLEGKNEKQDRQTSMWFSKVGVDVKLSNWSPPHLEQVLMYLEAESEVHMTPDVYETWKSGTFSLALFGSWNGRRTVIRFDVLSLH